MDNKKLALLNEESIKNKILTIRGVQVMIDKDLADLYMVDTKRLNEQVKRNLQRFPLEFMFQLTKEEKEGVVANCDHLNSLKYSPSLPYVFTEQGVAMLSGVLNSDIAIQMSIKIINSFVLMRKFIYNNSMIINRLDNLEQKQIQSDTKFEKIFNLMENHLEKNQGIFFEGQIFDAHIFISNLIRKAKTSILLIDNYIDDTTLYLFSKRAKGVDVIIYTKYISKTLKLDLDKFNSQYEPIQIKEFTNSHDRFIIIDDVVYHIGSSLKDIGKKWFAFSKMEKDSITILDRIEIK